MDRLVLELIHPLLTSTAFVSMGVTCKDMLHLLSQESWHKRVAVTTRVAIKFDPGCKWNYIAKCIEDGVLERYPSIKPVKVHTCEPDANEVALVHLAECLYPNEGYSRMLLYDNITRRITTVVECQSHGSSVIQENMRLAYTIYRMGYRPIKDALSRASIVSQNIECLAFCIDIMKVNPRVLLSLVKEVIKDSIDLRVTDYLVSRLPKKDRMRVLRAAQNNNYSGISRAVGCQVRSKMSKSRG